MNMGLFMIPRNINQVHVLKAIEEIDRKGIPKGRNSRKFQLLHKRRYYPPKFVISLANKYANNVELDSSQFGGGIETNHFLEKLGFEIVEFSPQTALPTSVSFHRKSREKAKPRHSERCPKCKKTVEMMLRKIYGIVEVNYRFEIGAKLEDHKGTSFYAILEEIFSELQNHRNHKDFVKSKKLPHCDFFVPNPGFVLEFDESQHFTACRKISLLKYFKTVKLGFEREKWISLCEIIDTRDNDPPYRDEQRAWYDVLRDFLPSLMGLRPTIRLYSRDFRWCSLNPEISSHVERFKAFLEVKKQNWKIELREDQNPSLGRIIIAGSWSGDITNARQILEDVVEAWPKGKKVNFLLTCGGFVTFDWPDSLSYSDIGDNRFPEQRAVNLIIEEARRNVKLLLNDQLRQKLSECSRYMTIGVDTSKSKISTTGNYISEPHVELVFLIDLENDNYYWTGKSYPTPSQEKGLVRINDLHTHFFDCDLGKIMTLGCHDLTVFNPRSDATARGWRKKVKDEFKRLSRKEKPLIVLQHPHTTDSARIWTAAWNRLKSWLPTVEQYASAGRYFNEDRPCRSELTDVLAKTKYGKTIDFVIWIDMLNARAQTTIMPYR